MVCWMRFWNTAQIEEKISTNEAHPTVDYIDPKLMSANT